jgi:hypothetical protein
VRHLTADDKRRLLGRVGRTIDHPQSSAGEGNAGQGNNNKPSCTCTLIKINGNTDFYIYKRKQKINKKRFEEVLVGNGRHGAGRLQERCGRVRVGEELLWARAELH